MKIKAVVLWYDVGKAARRLQGITGGYWREEPMVRRQ